MPWYNLYGDSGQNTREFNVNCLATFQVDEIKAKDRTIFSLEKELETTTGFLQKLQLQKDALDEQLFLVKEAECNLGSPKREIPGRAGDGAEHCGSPVRSYKPSFNEF